MSAGRVLVIDDEPQIRRALKAGLERNGYNVFVAASGEEGLDLAALERPEVVIPARTLFFTSKLNRK